MNYIIVILFLFYLKKTIIFHKCKLFLKCISLLFTFVSLLIYFILVFERQLSSVQLFCIDGLRLSTQSTNQGRFYEQITALARACVRACVCVRLSLCLSVCLSFWRGVLWIQNEYTYTCMFV